MVTNRTKTAHVMKPISAVVFFAAVACMLYGLFTPGARWLLAYGFVVALSSAFSSLGFWATQDLDKESPAGASPKSPFVVLPREDRGAA